MMFKKIGFLTTIALIFGTIGYSQGLTSRQLKASSIKNGSGVLTLPTSTDTLVGRATTDTMTNKTLTTPSTDIVTYDDQASTPSNPSAGFYKSYIKTDGKAYILNSSGTESKMGSGGGVFEASQNLILNNSFESDTSGWTASGGTLVRVTTAAHIIPPGIGAGSWDPSATSQTLSYTSTTVTANDGLSGRNGVLSCAIKTAATDLKMQAYDGSNVLTPNGATDVVPSSSTGFKRYSLNFIIPASGTIQARFLSASDSAIAYIDDCFFGLAEGFNISNVSSAQFIGSGYVASTAACTPARTNTVLGAFSDDADCPGVTVELNPGPGTLQTTDTDNLDYTFNGLPPGNYVAVAQLSASATSDWAVAINDGTTTSGVANGNGNGGATFQPSITLTGYFTYTTSGNRTFSIFGSSASGAITVHGNGANGRMLFSLLRMPLSSEQAYRPDTSAASWSGYHDTTCSWSRTNTAVGAFTADASCALVERYNVNFGAVSTTGSVLPALSFVPPSVGKYLVCASGGWGGNTAGNDLTFALFGNSVKLDDANMRFLTGGNSDAVQLCGIMDVSSIAATTVELQGAATAGTVNIFGTSPQIASVNWKILQISQSLPAPLLVGSVLSNTTGIERIERAWIDNTGVPAINNQSGSWISSVSDTALGQVTVNFAAGMFSAKPQCVVNAESISVQCTVQGEASTSSQLVRCRTNGAAPADNDNGFSIICMGPR